MANNVAVDNSILTQLLFSSQNLVKAVNALNQSISKVFPQGQAVTSTATAGTATLPAQPAKFLTVTLPDGTTGKIAVYNT